LLVGGLKVLIDEYKENEVLLVIVGDGAFRKELEEKINRLDMKDCVLLQGVSLMKSSIYGIAQRTCSALQASGRVPNVVLEAMHAESCSSNTCRRNPGDMCSDEIGLLTERNESQIARKYFSAEEIVEV